MEWNEFDTTAQKHRVLNLILWKDGKEWRWDYDDEIRRNVYSASKSFTSAAVGIAIREGLLSLEEKLTDTFSGDLPDDPCAHLRQATVRDLLTMCLGMEKPLLMGEERPFLREKDWVKYCLSQPFSHKPGTKFLYSNAGPYLAGVLIQRRAGCTLADYLRPRLFTPLGIENPLWETDPHGLTFGAGGLFLCTSELLKFGRLLLQNGCWDGRQLIPSEYLEEATGKQVENGAEGYGYLFWRGKHRSYRADGKYGQYAMVFPKDNAVLAVSAECHHQGDLLDFLMGQWEWLKENF